MYFVAQPPPESFAGVLRVLRLSLNAPVVDVPELPVGPARAGIALWHGPAQRPALAVAVRSLRGDRLACYVAGGESDDLPDAALAVDAALSFAESMGFLFDDDVVGAAGEAGPREAGRLWQELLGLEPAPADEEVLLQDVVESDPARPPQRVLTKFRRSDAPAWRRT